MLRRLLCTTSLIAAGLVVGPLGSPAAADHERLPRDRHIVKYTVRPGDTATGLAVRFRSWTAELISHNHLGSSAALTVGQPLEIPVVSSRAGTKAGTKGPTKARTRERRPQRSTPVRSPDAARERVRRTIVATARHYGVDPQLALAISWQEAGWRMHHVSSAGAIGAMQVLPTTAEWMEFYVGRDLDPHRLQDNVTVGVVLIGVLAHHTSSRERQVAAYYQGLGAVQRYGIYDQSRPYVANVLAIKRRIEVGHLPA